MQKSRSGSLRRLVLEEILAAFVGELLEADGAARSEPAFLDVLGEALQEPLRRIQLPGIGLHLLGDEGVIPLGDRAEPVPVEPLLGDVASVTEVTLPQGRDGQELRDERLIRVVRGEERIQLDAVDARTAPGASRTPPAATRSAETAGSPARATRASARTAA